MNGWTFKTPAIKSKIHSLNFSHFIHGGPEGDSESLIDGAKYETDKSNVIFIVATVTSHL